MKAWFIERLKEPSTWRGLSLLLSTVGIGIAPELVYQIGMALGTILGAIEVARKES